MNGYIFEVKDKKTGEIANPEMIARIDKWAQELMSIDMEGFAIDQFGELILMDECGKFVHCPDGRFEVIWRPSAPVPGEGEEKKC